MNNMQPNPILFFRDLPFHIRHSALAFVGGGSHGWDSDAATIPAFATKGRSSAGDGQLSHRAGRQTYGTETTPFGRGRSRGLPEALLTG
jgi:hypothetical protein